MKRVIWFGNWFEDHYHIIKDGKYQVKYEDGGICNCKIDGLENRYFHEHDSPGEAHFLLSQGLQESAVDFKCSVDLTEKSLIKYADAADWLHIAYIDALPNLDLAKVSKEKYKVISCDFCEPKTKLVPDDVLVRNLKCCDYVFCGNFKLEVYDALNPSAVFIKHMPNGSRAFLGNDSYVSITIPKNYIFTVGAGDRFATAFIEARLNQFDLRQSQELAHDKVGKWLEEVNAVL